MRQLVGLILLCALPVSCSAFTDPAVRLAYSLEATLKEHQGEPGPIHATCDIDGPSSYIVVLHPDGELTEEQLAAAGLSPSEAETVRGLRLGSNASIYVISNEPGTPNSRTTYQRNFVRIPKLLVATRTSAKPLQVTIAGAPADRFIESIQ